MSEDSSRFEEKANIIIATAGKGITTGRPGRTANLLIVNRNATKQCQIPRNSEDVIPVLGEAIQQNRNKRSQLRP